MSRGATSGLSHLHRSGPRPRSSTHPSNTTTYLFPDNALQNNINKKVRPEITQYVAFRQNRSVYEFQTFSKTLKFSWILKLGTNLNFYSPIFAFCGLSQFLQLVNVMSNKSEWLSISISSPESFNWTFNRPRYPTTGYYHYYSTKRRSVAVIMLTKKSTSLDLMQRIFTNVNFVNSFIQVPILFNVK